MQTVKEYLVSINRRQPEPKEQDQEELRRGLSRHQYGTLRFIFNNRVSLEYLKHAHATTLGSLAYRGYLMRVGPKETDQVMLTPKGEAMMRHYDSASLNERSHEGELTERCQRLLKYSARHVQLVRTA